VRKEEVPILSQGCTQLVWGQNNICWSRDYQDLAVWVESYLELNITRGSQYTKSRMVTVSGWKGELSTVRMLDGKC
jgi:hypothetical protein